MEVGRHKRANELVVLALLRRLVARLVALLPQEAHVYATASLAGLPRLKTEPCAPAPSRGQQSCGKGARTLVVEMLGAVLPEGYADLTW